MNCYASDPLRPLERNELWQLVDILRIHVLSHSLEDYPGKVSVYADFDVEDVHIRSGRFKSALQNHGFAVGTPRAVEEGKIENSFFAVDDSVKGKKILKDILFKFLFANQASSLGRNAVYSIFRRTIEDHFHQTPKGQLNECLVRAVRPSGVKTPAKLEYARISVNP